jgi:hypothetical protein
MTTKDLKTSFLENKKPLEGYSNTRKCLFVLINICYVIVISILVYITYIDFDTVSLTVPAGVGLLFFYPLLIELPFILELSIKELKEKKEYYKDYHWLSTIVLEDHIKRFSSMIRAQRRRNNAEIRHRRRYPNQPKTDLEYIDPYDLKELSDHSSDEEEDNTQKLKNVRKTRISSV